MNNCSRNTLCVDCDNTNCVFQGEKKSDCPHCGAKMKGETE